MPEFAVFQQNAKQLSKRLTSSLMKQSGCFILFKGLGPHLLGPDTHELINVCTTISMVANSLNMDNDDKLISYIQGMKKDILTYEEFIDFKVKVLTGIYLLKWFQHSISVVGLVNKSLIELFQTDLNTASIADLDNTLINSSLEIFSQYCSFIFQHQKEQVYADLNKQLGDTIQVEIYTVQHQRTANHSSLFGVYTGIISILGMK